MLNIIAQAKGLVVRQQGNVIWIAPRAEVAASDKLEYESRLAIQNLEPLQTRAFALNYAKAHDVVLQVMREGLKRGREQGDLKLVRQMAHEIGIWFPQHAQTMDAALAQHLRGVGYDAATGKLSHPEALPAGEIHGCGGDSCS